MNNSSDSSSSKPSLETLLRLKRAERPDEAFWSDFDAQLRQKQLAAIIEPKPWWLGTALLLRRFSVPAVAITSGAAAVLTFTVIRNGLPIGGEGFNTASVIETAPQISGVESASEVALAATVLPVVEMDPVRAGEPVVAEVIEPVLVATLESPVEFGSVGAMAGLDDVSESRSVADGVNELTLTELAVAADAGGSETLGDVMLASSVASLPVVVEFPAVPFEREVGDVASISWSDERVAVLESDFVDLTPMQGPTFAINASAAEDVASVSVAAAPGSRFERLLSADVSKIAANSHGSLAQVRDRVLHRLGGEEELYASVSRLGMGGDRLSLRF